MITILEIGKTYEVRHPDKAEEMEFASQFKVIEKVDTSEAYASKYGTAYYFTARGIDPYGNSDTCAFNPDGSLFGSRLGSMHDLVKDVTPCQTQ